MAATAETPANNSIFLWRGSKKEGYNRREGDITVL